MDSIKERIAKIFEHKIGFDRSKLCEQTFNDLGMDDLDTMMLTVCLEDEFKIIIDDEQLDKITTFKGLVEFVAKQVEKREREELEAS